MSFWDRFWYYADFVVSPLLVLAALVVQTYYNGLSRPLFAMVIVGYPLWTFIEYWIHRTVFHRFMRREHWLHHHFKPEAYDTVPAWQTVPLHLAALGVCLGLLGMEHGTGLFVGVEIGYLHFIVTHDRIHHGKRQSPWIQRRAALHDVHHSRGTTEYNFGSVTSVWDRLFGTYHSPL